MNKTKKKILIIDDEKNFSDVLRMKLETSGYSVRTAENGLAGIEAATETKPDLILLDVLMPGINGFETARRLKEEAETSPIPIIILTTADDPRTIPLSVESGAVDYVPKLLESALLVKKIEDVLAGYV